MRNIRVAWGFDALLWRASVETDLFLFLTPPDNFPPSKTKKMLAVFNKSFAKSPEGLESPDSESISALKDGCLAQHFSSIHPASVTINLGSDGLVAFTSDKQNPFLPRLFAVVDNIFCLFKGNIDNLALLKQQYGMNKTVNEVSIIIEAYKTLRDRGPYPANQVVRDLGGKFAFILYDSTSKTCFVAADADGSVPFFWGTDSEGHLVLSDDDGIVKKACGNSFAPYPKACFFTTSGGLRSFEHPLNVLKPVPRVNSSGQLCGANFKVDVAIKKQFSMPRVGSSANWSSQY
ncbi:hypothetical protein NE237_013002 [Protea cynaroides]|uniref:DUF3700 domain-containing protein n=1 Tax=Protea cynaroides TaxID=273540 RepID=A0A9Q0GZ14_9MAGN|nr:hypothetical protein NE237_013002 [Protea cynaroides]